MKAFKLPLILAITIALLACPGCSVTEFFLPQKPVYVPPGVLVEVAKDTRVECWITNKGTGARERHMVDIQGGWMIMRPRTDFDRGPVPEVAPKVVPQEDVQPEAEILPQKFARAR